MARKKRSWKRARREEPQPDGSSPESGASNTDLGPCRTGEDAEVSRRAGEDAEACRAGEDVEVSRRVGEDAEVSRRAGEDDEDHEDVDHAHDVEDDCQVAGDSDCEDVNDAEEDQAGVDGGRDETREDGLGVMEDTNLNIRDDFADIVGDGDKTDDDSGDEIWDDDRIPDPISDDDKDEEDDGQDRAEQDFRENVDDPELLISLGKTYNSPDDFKLVLLRYSLKTRYDIKLYKSESTRVAAKCCYVDNKGVECPWKVYAAYERKKHKLQVKTYINAHQCIRSGSSKMLKCSSIATLFEERLRLNPKLTKWEMLAEIKREYNLDVTDDQCAKAKTKVNRARKASNESHFARIWDYQAEVFLQNGGSQFDIETTPGPSIGSKQRFFRLYICFSSQKESWKRTCRPIIGLDGAFLKWDIKGHLLAAVGRDGDNRIVPIAWAVVEVENDDNWEWFVKKLCLSLGIEGGSSVTFISDKQKGLVKAIHNVVPEAEHRQCARHIMDNWKKDNRDQELQRIFWKIARSYTTGEFIDNMNELKKYNPLAHSSLQLTNPQTWSRAFFRTTSCCNDILNNLSESFNKTIRQARRKPLLDLLEDVRRQCMVRNAKRYLVADRLKTRFTKRAHAEIEKVIAGAQHCKRYMARNNMHEIEVHGVNYTVDMNARTCGCRKWQMIGIPCSHAASVIIGKREKVEDYVVDYYTRDMWKETYRDGIKPVQGAPLWPRMNRLPVLPPPWRKGNPGRPPNYARRKGKNESSNSSSKTKMSRAKRVMTCSNCHQEGHNRQGCKNETVLLPPKRPRGRPRKNVEQGGSSSQPLSSQPLGSQHPQGSQPSQGTHGQVGSLPSTGRQAPMGSQTPHGRGQGLERFGSWFDCSRG